MARKLTKRNLAAKKAAPPSKEKALNGAVDKKEAVEVSGTKEVVTEEQVAVGTIETSVELPGEDTELNSEIVYELKGNGPFGEMSTRFGITIGLPRKFEFARIDIESRLPHMPTEAGREEAYKLCREFALGKLRMEIEKIRAMEKVEVSNGKADTKESK